jgi:hypothetical protein
LRVFENGFLQRTSGTKWEDEKGEWRKLHSEELHIVYSSPDIIIQIKSRRVRWAGHVARMGEEQKGTMFWWESPKGRDHSQEQRVGGKMGSEWILERFAGGWIGFDWLRIGTGGELL